MKVSEITLDDIYNQIREDPDYLTDSEKTFLETLKTAAIEYVKSYTGLNEEEMNEHEDITIAVLVLVSDMYDNREFQRTSGTYLNKTVETILGMYSQNLL